MADEIDPGVILTITTNALEPVLVTYASINYARNLEAVGLVTLPDDDAELEALLLSAMPYIESKNYQGHRRSLNQVLNWPRNLVFIDGQQLSNEIIPDGIKRAQLAAVQMMFEGVEITPTVSGQFITEETVGPITTKYSDEYLATWNGQTVFTEIDVFLTPFLISNNYRLSPAFGF